MYLPRFLRLGIIHCFWIWGTFLRWYPRTLRWGAWPSWAHSSALALGPATRPKETDTFILKRSAKKYNYKIFTFIKFIHTFVRKKHFNSGQGSTLSIPFPLRKYKFLDGSPKDCEYLCLFWLDLRFVIAGLLSNLLAVLITAWNIGLL